MFYTFTTMCYMILQNMDLRPYLQYVVRLLLNCVFLLLETTRDIISVNHVVIYISFKMYFFIFPGDLDEEWARAENGQEV